MRGTIREKLKILYGETRARELLPRVREMLEEDATALTEHSSQSTELSERDILLITYADQLRDANRMSPLQVLGEFLNTQVHDTISGVHILPFFPFSSDDGFSVTDYFSVDPQVGTWEDVARLGEHFDLMFDLVINHVSAQSDWFVKFLEDDTSFRDYFIIVEGNPDLSAVVRPRTHPLVTPFKASTGLKRVWTTFSADQIDLNYRNPEVLFKMLEALLFYVRRGARFIRLDAIAYLWKQVGTSCIHLPETHAVVQWLRAVLDEIAPWVMLITETNVSHEENISYFGDGSNEAQMVYNFALPPLVLHAFQTGDASALTRWASSLRAPRNGGSFFNFLASHDGIGINPARGILTDREIDELVECTVRHGGYVSYKQNSDGSHSPYELNINYFDALSNPNEHDAPLAPQIDRFMTSQAIMLALAGVPGIYFHSLFGSRGDRGGALSSGIPRRINREKLLRADLENSLSNTDSMRAQIFSRYSHMARVRRATPAFHPNAEQEVMSVGDETFAVLRNARAKTGQVLCLHNVANSVATVRLPSKFARLQWVDILHGNASSQIERDELVIRLQPYQTAWMMQRGE